METKLTSQQPAHPAPMENRRIWVIGGCGHLGHMAVRHFAGEGAHVLCADLPGAIEKARSEPAAKNIAYSVFNAFELDHIAPWCETAAATLGTPHAVVHLVTGTSRGKYFSELSADDLANTFQGTLTAGFLITRCVADLMAKQGGGSIVLFSSMYGLVSPDASLYEKSGHLKPNPLDYGVAKAGVVQMTKYCAMQYGRHGVRVNCIAPGPFPNPKVQAADPVFIERLANRTLLGRIGQPAEMIGPIRFLAGPESSYMTGQCLVIDGGWTAW